MSTAPLGPDEVHLWFTAPDELVDRPALLERYAALLDEEERARHRRFLFARHRLQFLVSHALVRTTLSRYADLDPRRWTFRKNRHGRPDIDNAGLRDLVFNLSHADGLAVCGVTRERDLGVDVEDTQRPSRTTDIASSFFSPFEVEALRALPRPAHRQRFFLLWTLKEAYIKARGMGLALPLDKFSFHVDDGPPIRLSVEPPIVDDPASWQFETFTPSSRHRASLALRRAGPADAALKAFLTVPLADEDRLLSVREGAEWCCQRST